ncbi:MAG: hypothetical protein V7K41_11420 [Nostoc sp.]|uniref:hypothetical protein n=1 Tax=Nostoc sp. TaxID=1180 RepID=UPI002FF89CFB
MSRDEPSFSKPEQTIIVEEEFRSQNSGVRIKTLVDSLSVAGLNPPLIIDHQILDLVGVLNPFIHPPLVQNSCLFSDS